MLVPPAPGVLCAEGLLAASLKAEFSRTLPRPDEWATADALFAALEAEAMAWLDAEQVPPADRTITRVALLRYEGQGSELAITWPGDAQAAQSAFAHAHHVLNGFTLEAKVELVTLGVEAEGAMPAPTQHSLAKGHGAEPMGRQIVHEAAGSVEASVYERAALGASDRLAGPAIVTQLDATTLIPRGWHAEALGSGALLLRRDQEATAATARPDHPMRTP